MYVTVPMTYETIFHEYSIHLDMFLQQNGESKFSWQPCSRIHNFHCSQLVFTCGVVLSNPACSWRCD